MSVDLSFNHRKLTKFPDIDESLSIDKLDLSKQQIKNFIGMKEYQSLNTLIMDDNPLSSFEGVFPENQLEVFSCMRTPLGNSKYLILMALTIFGDTLMRVNGVNISNKQKNTANLISNYIGDYLCDGWILMNVNPIKLMNPTTRQRKTIYVQPPKNEYSAAVSPIKERKTQTSSFKYKETFHENGDILDSSNEHIENPYQNEPEFENQEHLETNEWTINDHNDEPHVESDFEEDQTADINSNAFNNDEIPFDDTYREESN